MKKIKKITLLLMITLLAVCLSACGNKAKDKGFKDALYTSIYDSNCSKDEIDAIPENQFLPSDVRSTLGDGSMRLEVTLDTEVVGDYTLVVDYYDADQKDEKSDTYLKYSFCAIGTYESDGDKIILSPAGVASVDFKMGKTYADLKVFDYLSPKGDGSTGYFDNESNPELLEIMKGATFTVKDNNIVTWEAKEK
ncbi:MAG: hypothetical protein ACI3VR_03310 [Intestinibacter sp.]|uniref:hypothetical protein n=1 Tax=Intestinibacter sp. TaxID=1965304 RepID=UPI003F1513E4